LGVGKSLYTVDNNGWRIYVLAAALAFFISHLDILVPAALGMCKKITSGY
jgi:hypothetical protein